MKTRRQLFLNAIAAFTGIKIAPALSAAPVATLSVVSRIKPVSSTAGCACIDDFFREEAMRISQSIAWRTHPHDH